MAKARGLPRVLLIARSYAYVPMSWHESAAAPQPTPTSAHRLEPYTPEEALTALSEWGHWHRDATPTAKEVALRCQMNRQRARARAASREAAP
jgi:hypothetical protein